MKTRLIGLRRIRSYRLPVRLAPVLLTPVLLVGLGAPSGHAAPVDCLPMQQPLVKIPEIVTDGAGHLRGTVLLNDEEERINFRVPLGGGNVPGAPNTKTTCLPQFMRAYHAAGAPPAGGGLADPMPGPTLRARLGDIVELTFLNQINPADFGSSIDQDLVSGGSGCDEVSGVYPGTINQSGKQVPVDVFPNCFHGSSTGNIHFHGTHTNPDSTGDNVLVQVRPSNAQQDGANAVTAATYEKPFVEFFANAKPC